MADNQQQQLLINQFGANALHDGSKEKPSNATFQGEEAVHIFAPRAEVDFLKPATARVDNELVFQTSLVQFSNADNNGKQLCAYYLSAVCAVFVELEPVAKQALTSIGASCRDVLLPDQARVNLIEPINMTDSAVSNVHFGQLLFCLYKDISNASFTNFMMKRTNALRAFAGVDPSVPISYAINMQRAMRVKSMLGNNIPLRRSVLNYILSAAQSTDNFGQVCLYVARILAWTGMTSMVVVLETLLLPNSPVLTDLAVKNEVRMLADAFTIINSTRQPQYFKIIAEPEQQALVERSKFPLLMAVAHKLRQSELPSLAGFAQLDTASETTVARLVQLHKNFLDRRSLAATKSAIDYLTRFE